MNMPFDFSEWTDFVPGGPPPQLTSTDCGVFVCQTMEALSRGEELNLHQENMREVRERMITEIRRVSLLD